MKLRKPVRLTHQSKIARTARRFIPGSIRRFALAYTAAPSRVPQCVKSGRPLYGEVGKFKDSTGRLKQSTRRFPFLAWPFRLRQGACF